MERWSLKHRTILIVDDFPEMRSTLRSMLLPWQPERIDTARHGEDAIEKLQLSRYDIILCDFNLGEGKDGQQVLEEARHRNLLPFSSAFIMVSAETNAQMVMGAMETQPDGYISKPVTKVTLQVRLKKFVQKQTELRTITHAMDQKQYTVAVDLIDRYMEDNSKYRFELYKLKSDLLIRSGDYERAQNLCEAVLAGRELPWARFDIGRISFFRQDYKNAAAVFEKLLEANPTFISAYDWLAKSRDRLGNTEQALEALMEGAERSPRSLLRQRTLADLADRSGNLEITEAARRKAIRIGKGSVLREPGDYAALARVLVKRESGNEALRVAQSINSEFEHSPLAKLETATVTSNVYTALGNEKESAGALEEALSMVEQQPELVSAELGMSLTRACLQHKRQEDADRVIRQVICDHDDDAAMLAQITQLYDEAGAGDAISELIDTTRKEIVSINNEGVKLLKDGEIEASIELFSRAARGMPRNPVINLNAAQSLIRKMRDIGPSRPALAQALGYIQAAGENEMHRERQNRLLGTCREMAAGLPAETDADQQPA
ncbi:Chemotaxis regulator - transmits chemoreceptor signals to flagelllar motor components CheY [hydrothermal vent metagenome]|uniref:Chemotaxis regulator - transmits chemoreceptor signals to flagelllar motor components CheY n=1 Tax=hydrothermal vent metagenome TaxID=652676 RepID=A0A3B0YRX6_9ZZZZ